MNIFKKVLGKLTGKIFSGGGGGSGGGVSVDFSKIKVEKLESSAFLKAIDYTLKNEGVLSNDKFDRGGLTKYGIILQDLFDLGFSGATVNDVKNLTIGQAIITYKKLYWDTLELDKITNDSNAVAIFDIGVVQGVPTVKKHVRNLVDNTDWTLAIEKVNSLKSNQFIPAFKNLVIKRFLTICEMNPTQEKFIRGWTNRANRLLTLIDAEH